jgi:hypothetical protein
MDVFENVPVKVMVWAPCTAPKVIAVPLSRPFTVPVLTQGVLWIWMDPDSSPLADVAYVTSKVPSLPGVDVLV